MTLDEIQEYMQAACAFDGVNDATDIMAEQINSRDGRLALEFIAKMRPFQVRIFLVTLILVVAAETNASIDYVEEILSSHGIERDQLFDQLLGDVKDQGGQSVFAAAKQMMDSLS